MLFNQHREIRQAIQSLERTIDIMSTNVNAGLAALQQADADLAFAITANTASTTQLVADVATLSSQLSAINSEDPAVQTIAADLETKVAALQANTAALTAAVKPPTPPPAPAV